ncbi:MAG: SUMF1/EgtB/PvdO family nonheme iron enzyme [Gemmatimonadota bacterium]
MAQDPETVSRRSIWVRAALVLGALVVIVGAWSYLQLARSVPSAEAARPASPPPPEPDLPGFRSDLGYLPNDDMLGFVPIPAGPFVMGSDPAVDPLAFENERWSAGRAQGSVDLPTFYIGRYEVTVAQYRAFVEATGHPAAEQVFAAPPDHPVARVSWTDALAYARWLERMLRESPATPVELKAALAEGLRLSLPDEAQWEKAARGTAGRIYPWGNEPRRDRANFGSGGTTAVGSFDCDECAYGIQDMSGNVWEWTRSPYQPLPFDPADDRDDLASDALWVMRGGAFNDSPQNVRTAIRGGADPGVRRPFIGFRVAITPF